MLEIPISRLELPDIDALLSLVLLGTLALPYVVPNPPEYPLLLAPVFWGLIIPLLLTPMARGNLSGFIMFALLLNAPIHCTTCAGSLASYKSTVRNTSCGGRFRGVAWHARRKWEMFSIWTKGMEDCLYRTLSGSIAMFTNLQERRQSPQMMMPMEGRFLNRTCRERFHPSERLEYHLSAVVHQESPLSTPWSRLRFAECICQAVCSANPCPKTRQKPWRGLSIILAY